MLDMSYAVLLLYFSSLVFGFAIPVLGAELTLTKVATLHHLYDHIGFLRRGHIDLSYALWVTL